MQVVVVGDDELSEEDCWTESLYYIIFIILVDVERGQSRKSVLVVRKSKKCQGHYAGHC